MKDERLFMDKARSQLRKTDPCEGPTEQEAEACLQQLASLSAGTPGLFPTASSEHWSDATSALRVMHGGMTDGMYRTLVEELPVVTFLAQLGEDCTEIYVSPQIEALLGFSQQEWRENPVLWYERLHPEDKERWNVEFSRFLILNEPFQSVYRFIASDERVVWVRGDIKLVRDAQGRPVYVQGVGYDITELKQAEESLRLAHERLELRIEERTAQLASANAALREEIAERQRAELERERYLAEIEALNERLRRSMSETHHRVKNNLQVVSALVDMQVYQHPELVPTDHLKTLAQHIRALATLHDLLTQQAKADAEVEFLSVKAALEKLFTMLHPLLKGRQIHVQIEDLRLPVQNGTAFIVLVNELISNAVKHGAGDIRLTLAAYADRAQLTVEDQGPGFPAQFDSTCSASTGLELIESLSQWDLKGAIRYENRGEGGARVVVEFPLL